MEKDRDKSFLAKAGISIAAILALLYFFRPWLHGIVMGLYTSPVLLEILIAFSAAVVVGREMIFNLFRDEPKKIDGRTVWLAKAVSGAALLLLIVGFPLSYAFEMSTLSSQVQSDASELERLPDIDPERPRILPKSVAEEYASNSLQTPRYSLSDADIAVDDKGTPMWSMAKKPDGLFNVFLLKQEGAAFVDMTTQNKKVEYTEDRMNIGIGMGLTDNFMWSLKKKKFFAEYEDPVNIQHNNKTYIAVPYKQFNFHFDSPIFHTAPEWAGVALINPEGEIKYLSPEEAARNEVLRDQRIYPYNLARKKVSSLAYKHGIVNAWFTHKDQLEVAGVPGENNNQPFTILTEDGVKLFIAAEPYGNAQGLFQIWTVDASTGDYSVLKLNRSEALLGANKATNYVRKANSKVNWADRSSGEKTVQTGFKPSEPVPVVVNDRLYWQVRVVPLDSAGIAFTSFVEAETGDVINAEKDSEITEFLRKEKTPAESNQSKAQNSKSEGTWTITVLENGKEVKKIDIGRNQSVRFQKAD
jgi:hypothetical protein